MPKRDDAVLEDGAPLSEAWDLGANNALEAADVVGGCADPEAGVFPAPNKLPTFGPEDDILVSELEAWPKIPPLGAAVGAVVVAAVVADAELAGVAGLAPKSELGLVPVPDASAWPDAVTCELAAAFPKSTPDDGVEAWLGLLAKRPPDETALGCPPPKRREDAVEVFAGWDVDEEVDVSGLDEAFPNKPALEEAVPWLLELEKSPEPVGLELSGGGPAGVVDVAKRGFAGVLEVVAIPAAEL